MSKTVNKLLVESSLSRLYQKTQDHDVGIITAFRDSRDCGEGAKYTKKENKQRNKSLLAKLFRAGYQVTSVKGSYIENYGTSDAVEVGEHSFFVVDAKNKGKLEKDLRKLGELFDQDSILYVKKGGTVGNLIGTNKCTSSFPGYGISKKLQNAIFGKSGEFQTRVNGRPFVLKEGVYNLTSGPSGSLGKLGVSLDAKEDWENIEV